MNSLLYLLLISLLLTSCQDDLPEHQKLDRISIRYDCQDDLIIIDSTYFHNDGQPYKVTYRSSILTFSHDHYIFGASYSYDDFAIIVIDGRSITIDSDFLSADCVHDDYIDFSILSSI